MLWRSKNKLYSLIKTGNKLKLIAEINVKTRNIKKLIKYDIIKYRKWVYEIN